MGDDLFDEIEPYNRHRSQTWSGQIRPYKFISTKMEPMDTNFVNNFEKNNQMDTEFLDLDLNIDDKRNVFNVPSISGPTSNDLNSSMNLIAGCTQPDSPEDDYFYYNNPDTPQQYDAASPVCDTSQDKISTPFANKKSSRRNPWGNETYSDMITKSIENSPGQRATLQQVYDYIVTHYRYFRERSDPTSSAGWKNSIRHNLSLHEKFIKCAKTNDNAKSSYWIINHDAVKKPYMRRRASSMDAKKALETSKKANIFKKKSTPIQKKINYCDVDTPDSNNTSSSYDFSIENYQMRARSGSNVSGISHISRPSDQVSLTSPLGMNQAITPACVGTAADIDMDRISEELCLEVVRRIVVGEDEGDLLVCQSGSNSPSRAQEPELEHRRELFLDVDHFEENVCSRTTDIKQEAPPPKSFSPGYDVLNNPLPLRSSAEINKMISVSSSCLSFSSNEDFNGSIANASANHVNLSKFSPIHQQVILPSQWT